MLFRGSAVRVSDNSGAKIGVIVGFKRSIKCAYVGLNTYVKLSIRVVGRKKFFSSLSRSKIRRKGKIKGSLPIEIQRSALIYKAFILSTRKFWRRGDGRMVRTFRNRVILISDRSKLIGSQIVGPISRELKKRKKRTLLLREIWHKCRRYV